MMVNIRISNSNAASSAIANLENEENSSDSDDEYAVEEATIHTNNGTRAPGGSNDDGQRSLVLVALNLPNCYRKTATLKSCNNSREDYIIFRIRCHWR